MNLRLIEVETGNQFGRREVWVDDVLIGYMFQQAGSVPYDAWNISDAADAPLGSDITGAHNAVLDVLTLI